MSHISPVIPRNIARAKRIAKQLQAFYPSCQLSTCQATTAHLFGFKDWHALEEVCKSTGAKARGPFDAQLDEEAFIQRKTAQAHILCKELSGVDPLASHMRPADPLSKSTVTKAELLMVFAERMGQTQERLDSAGARWSVTFAENIVDEIDPTGEDAPPTIEYIDLMSNGAEYLQSLPALLGQWWSVNIPHQPEVGAALTAFKLDPHRGTSLLLFGRYWGTLCVYYSDAINWTMAVGAAYMIAERHGDIYVQQQRQFFDLIEGELTEASIKAAMPEFRRLADFARHEFFECYPRDDFAEMFDINPMAFVEDAKEVREILSAPGSNRGTWADNN